MKSKTKYFLNYITKFFSAILFFIISILSILLITVFNKNFILDILEKNDYYNGLNTVIKNQMSYQVVQAGFDDEVLDGIYDEDLLRRSTKKVLDGLYNNKEINISTSKIEEELNKNIEEYVANRGFTIDDREAVDKFVVEMTNIYKTNIGYSNVIEKVRTLFNNSYRIILIGLIISVILFIGNYFFSKTIFKERNIIVSLFTTGILLIFFSYYVKENIDINNITIYTELISKVIINYLNDIFKIMDILGIIYIIIGLIMIILLNKFISTLKKYKKAINIILLIIWMIVIFLFSSQNGNKSTNTSDKVTLAVINITTTVTGNTYTDEEIKNMIIDKTTIVRKSAHFIEYLILGVLIINVLKDYAKINKRMILFALMFCFLYAISDELHQLFSDGRTCKILDIFIDTSGSFMGILIYNIFYNIYLKREKNKDITYNI